MSGLFVVVLSF